MDSAWVYSLIGDPFASEHGTPYVQIVCKTDAYANLATRADVEQDAHSQFNQCYPGHCVCQARWDLVDLAGGES